MDECINLLVIAETWSKPDESSDFPLRDICPKRYTFLHCPHSSGSGGVCVHNNLLHVVDSHCCVVLLLLDLSATFDTVDYNLLLNRLESKFATRGKALQSFKSYLSQYSQFVSINLEKS